MSIQPDIVINRPGDRPALVVEVEGKRGATPEWAAEWRSTLLSAYDHPWHAPYFLMAFPDRFYFWRQGRASSPDQLPDHCADARELLAPLLERSGAELDSLSASELEMVVSTWLTTLMHPALAARAPQRWLVESGLQEAIRNGAIGYPAAA
jgi:hypothetical protein